MAGAPQQNDDWVEVPNIDYAGPKPDMPKTRTIWDTESAQRIEKPLHPLAVHWWEANTTLPHAILWTPGDWVRVIENLMLIDTFFEGQYSNASEIRQRENEMGTTEGALRRLRIRYVDPKTSKLGTVNTVGISSEDIPTDPSARRQWMASIVKEAVSAS